MKKIYKKMGLRWRILFIGSLIVTAMVIIQVAFFAGFLMKYFGGQIREENIYKAENLLFGVNDYFNNITNNLNSIYEETDFLNRIIAKETDYKDRTLVQDIIKDHSMQGDCLTFYIYDTDGEKVSTYHKSSSPDYPSHQNLFSEFDEEFIAELNSREEKSVVIGYTEEKKSPYAMLLTKLYTNRGRDIIGYILCDIDLRKVRSVISRYELGNENSVYFNYYNGLQTKLLSSAEYDNPEYVISELSPFGYTIGIAYPDLFSHQKIRSLFTNIVLLNIVILTLWYTVVFISSKKMTWQLNEIITTLKKVENNDMQARVTQLYGNEYGKIGKHINQMLDQLQINMEERVQFNRQLSETRYYALQAQINPHFLFNTLGTMAGIAQVENCPLVQEMCSVLSDIFRYNILGNIDKQFVTLQEELSHVNNYMYIENVRNGGQIQFFTGVDDEVLKASIPKLSIQPLVENAVEHGLRNKRGEKKLWIYARKENADLLITVEDNGVGFGDTNIQELYQQSNKKHLSIGLKNIRDRISYLYGQEFGLYVQSEEGTKVVLHLPYRLEAERENK